MDDDQLGALAPRSATGPRQGNAGAGARRQRHQRLLRLRRQPARPAGTGRLPDRPPRKGRVPAPHPGGPPPHESPGSGHGRGRLGRADRSVRAPRRGGEPCLLRLPPPASEAVNLLPQPRSMSVGGARRPWIEPSVATDPSLPREGYRLSVSDSEVKLTA